VKEVKEVKEPKSAIARKPKLYAIGGVAAYWTIGRIVSIVA